MESMANKYAGGKNEDIPFIFVGTGLILYKYLWGRIWLSMAYFVFSVH